LKETTDKSIYLLSDDHHHFFILKKGTGRQATLLKQEHLILLHLEASDYPYYPKMVDFWTEAKDCYLLRTYIEGTSLADYWDKKPVHSFSEVLDISIKICDIIGNLHQQQPPIIHRDIKPENFIVHEHDNTLFLVDFDTARQFQSNKSRDTQLVGTPSHAAPEQFGFYQSDFRTDIYGIGKTILYLATGSSDEKDCTTNTLTKSLYRIVQHCIAFSPEKRYSDIKTLRRDLKRHLSLISFQSSLGFHICLLVIFLLCVLSSAFGISTYYNYIEHTKHVADDVYPAADSSLRNEAEPSSYNLYQYQETFDTILLSYFADDYETMIIETERLIEDLYANEALCEIEAEDYSLDEYLPEHFWYQEPPRLIRTFLVYRNSIMKENLGNYAEVRPFIVGSLNAYFYYPGLFEGTPNIVLYSTCSKEEQSSYYEQALIDYLSTVNGAFDSLYGYESPTEKGYSDE